MTQSVGNDSAPVGPGGGATSAQDFREAMSRVAGTVHVVATDGPSGRGGATVTAVSSVSDAPPTLLVCLNRTGRLNAAMRENEVFSVNTLVAGDEEISGVFAGVGGLDHEARFTRGIWSRGVTGSPLLDGARAVFDCRISQIVEAGSHTVFFGEVVAARAGEKRAALVYLDRGYHTVGEES